MAALLESLLLRNTDIVTVKVHKQEFVPFLLNFLREQSSQALTHGPATPAKTPSGPRPAAQTHGFTERRGCRSASSGAGARSTSRVQLFSSASSVGGNVPMGAAGRHGGGRGGHHHSDEMGRWENWGKRSGRGGYNRISEQVSPPSVMQLNLSNLEDFPPVGSSPVSPVASKPSRRINPTPVSAERPHSKPKTCFTSTPFSKPSTPPSAEKQEGSVKVSSPLSLQEERELLKREKTKRAQQVTSPLPSTVDACTPTKSGLRTGSKVTPDVQTPYVFLCLTENLVPNIFLELFFVMQLLTSRSTHTHDDDEQEILYVLERCYLRQVHNCVYFAVKVLESHFQLVAHLDKCTLRLLAENERVASFSLDLRDRLNQAQDKSAAKVNTHLVIYNVFPFQPATDNRSNFNSDKAFHTFKKQRDIFYEVLREWEDYHKEPGWSFDTALGGRIRGMMSQLTSAGNHSHFARLFLKQLVQMCKGPRVNSSPGDTPDADLLGMLGADSLGRLKRLEERLIQPHGVVGPCPPPSFPGHQEFFRDFLQTASCCQLNQHLQDSLCQQLLQLDEVSILSPPAAIGEGEEEGDGDMEQQVCRQKFTSVLLLARLLAKFLGFISFLPYQTSQTPSREIQEAALALRSKSVPVLDVCALLSNSVKRRRTILTVPWLVEFLSMLDCVGPLLPCYRTALGTLLLLYRKLLGRCGEMCYLNKLLMVSVLGWLFQIPVIPEDVFFTSEFTDVAKLEDSSSTAAGLVSERMIQVLCIILVCAGEFRKLLAAFVSGSTAKSGGIIRKITPTSAELRDTPTANRSQQKLQVDLEQAFFHNQPLSLRRTVEFVAERVGSNAVKHMKATLVSELVEQGEKLLRDGLESPNSNPSKLNDSICAQLCVAGLEALAKATRYCCEKSPEAIRILLPDETSPAVLSTSENITKRLATDKACSWLSANITGSQLMHLVPLLLLWPALNANYVLIKYMPSIFQCSMILENGNLLSIAVGPRAGDELPTGSHIKMLLQRVGDTLVCRKVRETRKNIWPCRFLYLSQYVSHSFFFFLNLFA
uniref:Codanin-1 C-terminal domain-containing protein n=1 Tax=Mola mola TaxID=94237 RepID=A0A3Q3WJ50_MOLML